MNLNFKDLYLDIMNNVNKQIQSAINNLKVAYICEVTNISNENKSLFVDIKLLENSNNLVPLKHIPIIQSQYISPITQIGDIGLILNIKVNIEQLLYDGKIDNNLSNKDYFIFIPLIKYSNDTSLNNNLTIKSADLKSHIELQNELLDISLQKDFNLLVKKNKVDTIENDFNININNNKSEAIKNNCDLNIENNYNIKVKNKTSLNSDTIEIIGKNALPLKIKNGSGDFTAIVNQLFNCMDNLAKGMKGSATEPSAYSGVKSSAKNTILKILS